MRTLPPEPHAGERISASLVRELIRAIRERTPIAGRGVKVSTGPNGSVVSAESAGRASSAKTEDTGCFAIDSISTTESDDETNMTVTFRNRHYRIGGRTYTKAEESVTVQPPCIVALSVNASGGSPVAAYAEIGSLSELMTEEEDASECLFPLYEFNDQSEVACDFRTAPVMAMGEFA